MSSSEPTNRRPTVHRWLFEVEGDRGRTLWTRRRIEDTRQNGADPVNAPNVARGSQRVTQKKVHLEEFFCHLATAIFTGRRASRKWQSKMAIEIS